MANFVGGVGAAFIMAAVAALIVKFLIDTGLIKNRENALICGRVSLCTIIVGVVYMIVTALMFNEIKGQTNFFDLERIYDFLGTNKVLALCKEPDLGASCGGLMMPLYPFMVHIFGRIVFEQYVLTAQFISFVCACTASCLIYSVLCRRTDKDSAQELMLLAASAPYAFMLFAPTYISMTLMMISAAGYMLSRKQTRAYIALAILACLSSKIGVIAFLMYPFADKFSNIVKALCGSVVKSKQALRIIISLLALFNGAAIYWLIR